MFFNKRSTTRSQCNIPLQLAWEHPDNCYEVVASNISNGGMCLESCPRMSHDIMLYIRTARAFGESKGNNNGEAFVAKVKWIKKISREHLFEVGVEHMTQSSFLNKPSDYCNYIPCDMCGNSITSNLHRTGDDLHLCTDCFWNIGFMDNSVMQSSLTRFISGNVF